MKKVILFCDNIKNVKKSKKNSNYKLEKCESLFTNAEKSAIL